MSTAAFDPTDQQLADIAELVQTGPVDLGAYTQAELAVVLGDVPALAGSQDAVLAEAVRSLAARGVLYRVPGSESAEVVGDLGLLVALVAHSVGTMDIRRGHAGPADAPWRWLISLFRNRVVGIDRIDALGLHRLSLYSVGGIAKVVVDRMIDGKARVPEGAASPVPITDAQVRALAEGARTRWQVIHRIPQPDGPRLVVDAPVLRLDDTRVEVVTRHPGEAGYQRFAVDHDTLQEFLVGLFRLGVD